MTAHEGYVWFLPSWYGKNWWDVDLHNKMAAKEAMVPCTTKMMKYAVDGHFMLSKDAVRIPEDARYREHNNWTVSADVRQNSG